MGRPSVFVNPTPEAAKSKIAASMDRAIDKKNLFV
jgi:hypothetical protein